MRPRLAALIATSTVLLLAFAAFLVALWQPSSPVASERLPAGHLRVVTTFLPLYIFTVNVAGDRATVENLLPPGAGPHEYSFTPGDLRRLAAADVVVENGLGAEAWAERVIKESGTKAKVIDGSRGVPTRGAPPDPHIWLDPARAEMMVKNIARGLAAIDPANAPFYQRNANSYIARLEKLDAEIVDALARPRIKTRDFIAFHSAFSYFAEHYGLRQRAVIEEFPGKDPGAKYLAEVVDLIKREKLRAVFSEPQFSPRVVLTVAAETGLKVRELDPLEVGDLAPDTYEKAMRKNLQTLVTALSE